MRGEILNQNFYQPEVREGFFVEGMMKRAWAAQLDIIEVIDEVCKRHHLRWFAFYGTLLGAVRHHGYIPWDDDIDLAMLRPDYDKLVGCLKAEIPDGYVIQYPNEAFSRNTANSFMVYCKVYNSNKANFSKKYLERNHGCPYPCFVDIFPLDGVSDNQIEMELMQDRYRALNNVVLSINRGDVEGFRKNVSFLEHLLGYAIGLQDDIFENQTVLKESLGKLAVMEDHFFKTHPVEQCKKVDVLQFSLMYGRASYFFEKEWFSDIRMMPFENRMIPCPVCSEEVLKRVYGAQFMVPVKGAGAAHAYPFYKYWHEKLDKVKKEPVRKREQDFADCMNVHPRELRELSGGRAQQKTGATYYRYFFDGRYFLNRIFDGAKDLKEFDFAREKKLYQGLSGKGLVIEPVILRETDGYKIAPYFEKAHFLDSGEESQLACGISVLREFHKKAVEEACAESPLDFLQRFWKEREKDLEGEERGLFQKILHLEERLFNLPMHEGLAHMALSERSFLFYPTDAGIELSIVNLKYAGMGDVDWDIGIFSAGLFYDDAMIARLLSLYYENDLSEVEFGRTCEKVICYAAVSSFASYIRDRFYRVQIEKKGCRSESTLQYVETMLKKSID